MYGVGGRCVTEEKFSTKRIEEDEQGEKSRVCGFFASLFKALLGFLIVKNGIIG
jgi:hypothetical protein